MLSHLIRELGLDLSILHGQIDDIQGQTFGSLAVFASGPPAQITAAIAYLQRNGVQVRQTAARRSPMFENFSEMMLELFAEALWETVLMVGVSGLLGGLFGIPLGVFLRLTDKGGVLENTPLNVVVGGLVNAARSTPFIILLVAIIPFTRLDHRHVDWHLGGRGAADGGRGPLYCPLGGNRFARSRCRPD